MCCRVGALSAFIARAPRPVASLTAGGVGHRLSVHVLAGIGDSYFDGGVNAVLRICGGNTANAVGAASWVDFTDNTGAALAGAITITDVNG